ncbi:MAG: DHH family phosphoesterase, partial [Parcubacteria group bacterium]|nr:DHH family phosphoesterase [Parcubacteria group bacterium]
MELSPKQQGFELIQKSKKILLVTRENPDADSVGSLLAMGIALEKLDKEIDMVANGKLNPSFSFLPYFDKVKNELKNNKNFVITLDTSETKIGQFSYDFDNDGNKLNIYVTPKDGDYDSKHITTKKVGSQYDLIICLGSLDLESIGTVYDQNTELFYETPIINIDNQSANELYGEVNIVDLKASSTAEVLYPFLEFFDKNTIDEKIATCVLSGIIFSTKSFQAANTTPQAFNLASELISLGADQQKIVNNLYKNKSLDSLKLWGRALARVKFDNDYKIAWTLITSDDFKKTNANEKELVGIEDELAASITDAEIIIVLYEKENEVSGLIKTTKKANLEILSKRFNTPSQNDLIYVNFKDKTLL